MTRILAVVLAVSAAVPATAADILFPTGGEPARARAELTRPRNPSEPDAGPLVSSSTSTPRCAATSEGRGERPSRCVSSCPAATTWGCSS